MSSWQLIFTQSKANGCLYKDDRLPDYPWQWPQKTWFSNACFTPGKDDGGCAIKSETVGAGGLQQRISPARVSRLMNNTI